MRASTWGLALAAGCAFGAQAAEFDNRWFVAGTAGAAFTDSSDFDAGGAFYLSVGKALYPRFTVEGEAMLVDINVNDVGGSGVSADFERIGAGIKGTYDLLQIGPSALGLMGGASVRKFEWLGVEQTDIGGFAGLAFRNTLNSNFEFLAEGRYTVDPVDQKGPLTEDSYYHWTVTAGVRYKFGQWPPPAPDADRDGVPDSIDQCPNTPLGAQVNSQGCPVDSDGDGVPDFSDRCPNTPAGVPVDADGCPLDSDQDGVPDPLDKCPDTPRGVKVDADGCPLDSDQDGVPDHKDLCPNTPFGAEVDVNGCPFDTDQDGVPDFRDACPNTPYGTPVNDRGCSNDLDGDGVPNDIDECPNTYPGLEVDQVGCPIRNQTLTLHNVHFEFDKANLLPDSRQLLGRVAKSLMDQPDVRIEVGGHTDALGSDAYNQELSERRAAAVRSFLISSGVPAENVVSAGYGESRPIAENTTEDGRARNRRVEIQLLD